MNISTKKIIFIVALAIIASVGIFLFWQYFTTGVVKLTTSPNAKLYLVSSADGGNSKELGKTNATVRLKPGTYSFRSVDNNKQAQIIVDVVARKTISKALLLGEVVTPTKLIDVAASSIVARGNSIRFLNTSNNTVYGFNFIEKDEPVALSPSEYFINKTDWANYDISINESKFGQYIVFKDGVWNESIFSGDNDGGELVVDSQFNINSKGQIVFATNKEVRFKSNLNADYTTLTKISDASAVVSIANNGYVAVGKKAVSVEEEAPEASVDKTLTIFDGLNKKVVTTSKVDGSVQYLKWSADASKIQIATTNSLTVLDIKTGKENKILSYAPNGANSSIWLDNSTVLVSDQGYLWKSNISSGSLNKIAYLGDPSITTISSIAVSEDKKTVFFSTIPNGYFSSVGQVYKIDI